MFAVQVNAQKMPFGYPSTTVLCLSNNVHGSTVRHY